MDVLTAILPLHIALPIIIAISIVFCSLTLLSEDRKIYYAIEVALFGIAIAARNREGIIMNSIRGIISRTPESQLKAQSLWPMLQHRYLQCRCLFFSSNYRFL